VKVTTGLAYIKFDCIEWGWRPHSQINDYVTCVLQSLRVGISSAPTFGNEYGTQPLPYLVKYCALNLKYLSVLFKTVGLT